MSSKAASAKSFTKIPSTILARRDLSCTAKLVFAFVTDAMRRKRVSWPSLERIAGGIGVCEKTVRVAVGKLKEAGLLIVDDRVNGQVNRYRLPSETPVETTGLPANVTPVKTTGPPVETTGEAREKLPRKKKQTKEEEHRAAEKRKPTGPHAELIDHFTAKWADRCGGKYPFSGARDGKAAKSILDHVGGDLDRAKRIVDAYLADDDEWLQEHGAGRPLSLLASHARLGKYMAATADGKAEVEPARAPQEHPILEHAERKWPGCSNTHRSELTAVAESVEAGELDLYVVKRSKAVSVDEFLGSLNVEAAAHA